METSDGSGQALVIASETPEACSPSKGAFYDPASRQQDKAFPCLCKFHNFEADTMRRRVVGGRLPQGLRI
jgi:hypothetical protein